VVGFVGSLSKRQGLETLLRAVNELRYLDLCLLLVGRGEKEIKLKMYVKEYKLENHVIFTGEVPYSEIPAYIASMDIAILPDTSLYASPVKIFEYMAMSKAIIAPRKGQVEEVIKDGEEGILVKPGSKEELKKAILKLYKDKELREKMGKKAREKVEKSYTWRHNAEKIIKIFESIEK